MALNGEHVRRSLRFLSFGDPLHDELIKGWLPQGDGLVTLDVAFYEDHALWAHGWPGLYLLRLSVIDPAAALMGRGMEERLLDPVPPFSKLRRRALEADIRWIRAQFTACMIFDVRRREHGRWVQVEAEEAAALLNPMAHGRNGVPVARDLRAGEADIAAAEAELFEQRQADATAARSAWSHRFSGFKESLAARLTVVEEEGRDAVAVATEELRRSEEALEVARERGNRPQITRAENARDAAADTLSMTGAFWDERARWLRESEEQIRLVLPQEQLTALMRIRKVS